MVVIKSILLSALLGLRTLRRTLLFWRDLFSGRHIYKSFLYLETCYSDDAIGDSPPPCKVTGIYEFTGGKLISATVSPGPEPSFKGAELDMLTHLYRGEMYRSSGARDLMRRPTGP